MGTETPTVPTEAPAEQAPAPVENTPAEAPAEVAADGTILPPKAGTHYSPTEVAAFLGLKSTQTIYRYVETGKIVPAVTAGGRLIAFSSEQVEELRVIRARNKSGGGSRGDAKPNAFSRAFNEWTMQQGLTQNVIGDGFDVKAQTIGRWASGQVLPTPEAMVKVAAKAPELATPYIEAKAEKAAELKAKRDAKKAEESAVEAKSPEQIAAEQIDAA